MDAEALLQQIIYQAMKNIIIFIFKHIKIILLHRSQFCDDECRRSWLGEV